MAKLKIKLHPLFVLYVFLCVYFGWYNQIFYYVFAVFLHEMGHYVVAKHYGYEVDTMLFALYGAGLQTNNAYKEKDDIKISLAGPLVNLLIIVLSITFWWIIPSLYLFTYDFVICNIVVMMFNLLPIYPLDGGRVLLAVLPKKYNKDKVLKVSHIICFVLGIVFLLVFAVSIWYKTNYNLLFIGLFLAINGIISDRNKYFEKVRIYGKQYNKPLEVKVFRINEFNKIKMLKYLSPHYYSIFEYVNNGKIERIEEDILLK